MDKLSSSDKILHNPKISHVGNPWENIYLLLKVHSYHSRVEPHVACFGYSFTPNRPYDKLVRSMGASTFKSCKG